MAFNLNKGGNLGKYFYILNNVEYGPVEVGELLKYIDKDTLVYTEGDKWCKACETPELKKFFVVEERVIEKVVAGAPVEASRSRSSSYFLAFILFIALVAGGYWYYDFKKSLDEEKFRREQDLILQLRKKQADSIDELRQKEMELAQRDSVARDFNAKLDSIKLIEKKIMFLQNQEGLLQHIREYYQALAEEQFDAYMYFSDTVIQYVTVVNTNPQDINRLFSNKRDYLNESFLVDDNSFVFDRLDGDTYFFLYTVDYTCYRPFMDKTQNCQVDIEIGFDEQRKIKSYREVEVKNLVFE